MPNRNTTEKIFIVLPAYCEGKIIKKVIREIKKVGYQNIIVVDDGSSDNTYTQALSEDVITIKHLINRGKGAATQTGIDAAKLLGAEIIITLDADGQHSPKDIEKVVNPLIQKEADVVIGSRLLNNRKMPRTKKLMNKTGNLVTFFFYGIKVTDSQSGFRAYSKKTFGSLSTSLDGYEFESEMLGKIKKAKFKITEVPIEVIYSDYSYRKYSHLGKLVGQNFINGTRMVVQFIENTLIN